MIYKKLMILITIFAINSESTFKKGFHYYLGFSKFFRQDLQTSCIVTEKSKEQISIFIPKLESMNNNADYPESLPYVLFLTNPSSDMHSNAIKESCDESIKKSVFNHGFMFSIYLLEVFDIVSCGLCIANENWSEDSVLFNPKSGNMNSKINEQNKAPIDKDDASDIHHESITGILFFKRNTPLMIGGFVQVQNDDLESYSIAGRFNFMVGLANVYGITKDHTSIIHKRLTNKNKIFLKSEFILSISGSVIFKVYDFEVFMTIGCSWIPKGINVTRDQVNREFEMNTDNEGLDPKIFSSNIKTNHLSVFIAIGLGFIFD